MDLSVIGQNNDPFKESKCCFLQNMSNLGMENLIMKLQTYSSFEFKGKLSYKHQVTVASFNLCILILVKYHGRDNESTDMIREFFEWNFNRQVKTTSGLTCHY